MDRDERGRFLPGNALAKMGGQARARALCPHCRRQISRAGWRGLVEKRFHGDVDRARQWLGKLGAWASDAGYREIGLGAFQHPGPMG